MKDIPDPKHLLYHHKSTTSVALPRTSRLPRHKPGEKFLKGPVPLRWLTLAARLPGRSLHIGVVLWFLAGLQRDSRVALSSNLLAEFGVDRHAKYRALIWLEGDGLVTVKRHGGRNPVVTILATGK